METIEEFKVLIEKFDRLNDGTKGKLDYIYERQKEVNIGKRNINCLSCSKEPSDQQMRGHDGRLYKGPSRQNEEKLQHNTVYKDKKLLNMNWEHLGLNRAASASADALTRNKTTQFSNEQIK